jgi:excisionase family DNA binding protein
MRHEHDTPVDRLVTVHEAARLLSLRPGTIRLWLSQGRFPTVRVGSRAVRIPLSALESLIQRGTTPARPRLLDEKAGGVLEATSTTTAEARRQDDEDEPAPSAEAFVGQVKALGVTGPPDAEGWGMTIPPGREDEVEAIFAEIRASGQREAVLEILRRGEA